MKAGDKIGPYCLREPIGIGGMGEVWAADQQKPFKRRVALKIIKLGMDSKEVVSRFEAERQALALMNHPNVAKVYEAGTTPTGRPYFVMEYVAGSPITTYCDRHKLGLRERLNLFQQVCEGVQHAHQKAIIHRDLKPSNVLVTEQDNKATPKIIDFGVAKATAQKLTEQTVFTQLGVLIGTPEYMSPEQAELTGEGIDTRTDVYSLGVILYELLVGALPFDSSELRKAGFDGIRQMIREQDPPRPSTKVSSLGGKGSDAARARQVTIDKLSSQLSGDLDWIIMKSLEKDRRRRYMSPIDFSRDIDRHLKNLPVEARPPTIAYRLGRFVKRKKGSVIFSGIMAAIILGSGIALAVLYSRAVEAEHEAAKEAETATESLSFMMSLFSGSDPFQNKGKILTARDLLEKGAQKLEQLDNQPEVQIRLMTQIGTIYKELGHYIESSDILNNALRVQISEFGREHPQTIQLQGQIAHNYTLAEKYDEAEKIFAEALNVSRNAPGNNSLQTLELLQGFSFCKVRTSQYSAAQEMLTEALSILDSHFPELQSERATLLHLLGWSEFGLGEIEKAKDIFESSLAIRRTTTYEVPATAWTLNLLGLMLARQSDTVQVKEGISRLEDALALNQMLFDSSHTEIAYNLLNMSDGYIYLRDLSRAKQVLREGLDMGRQFLPESGTLSYRVRLLVDCLLKEKKHDEARQVILDHFSRLGMSADADIQKDLMRKRLDSLYVDLGMPEEIRQLQNDIFK